MTSKEDPILRTPFVELMLVSILLVLHTEVPPSNLVGHIHSYLTSLDLQMWRQILLEQCSNGTDSYWQTFGHNLGNWWQDLGDKGILHFIYSYSFREATSIPSTLECTLLLLFSH